MAAYYFDSEYPLHGPVGEIYQEEISLLDYFAGQALAGMLAASAFSINPTKTAGACYNMAEHMLAERQKRMGDTQ